MPRKDREDYLNLAAQRAKLMRDYQEELTKAAKVRRQGWYLKAEAREKQPIQPEVAKKVNKKLGQLQPKINKAQSAAYSYWRQAEEIEKKLRVAQLSEDEQMEYENSSPWLPRRSGSMVPGRTR